MEQFEARGQQPTRGFFLHGFDQVAEAVACSACGHGTHMVYRVSYDGICPKFDLCPRCHHEARKRWGIREPEGGAT